MAFREDKLLDNIDGCSSALIKKFTPTIVSVVIPRWWWEESTRQFVEMWLDTI